MVNHHETPPGGGKPVAGKCIISGAGGKPCYLGEYVLDFCPTTLSKPKQRFPILFQLLLSVLSNTLREFFWLTFRLFVIFCHLGFHKDMCSQYLS